MDRRKNPFVCYFCHKKIENDTEVGHMSLCGNVLVPCPHKCGAYIPRHELQKHQQECLNNRLTKTPNRIDHSSPDYSQSLDRRMTQHPSKELLDRLSQDFAKLVSRYSNFEQKSKEELSKLQDINHQNQVLLEWKKGISFQLDTVKSNLDSLQTDTLENLKSNFNVAVENFLKEQNYNHQTALDFAKNFNGLEDKLEKLQVNVEELRHDVETMRTKTSALIFDVKNVTQIATEGGERIELQQRDLVQMRQDMGQMRLDLEIVENLVAGEGGGVAGRLVWRVGGFEAKMEKAKQEGTVLKSPIFYTHDFGYRIRVLAYLNGLRKWKDRYTLIALHVLKGDYDSLQRWPCHIEGVVTLRDQENVDSPRNVSKRISAKRQVGDEENEEPQESSSSYIFIPHGTMMKSSFLKNDTIFFDVQIERNRKLLSETQL